MVGKVGGRARDGGMLPSGATMLRSVIHGEWTMVLAGVGWSTPGRTGKVVGVTTGVGTSGVAGCHLLEEV